MITPTNRVMSRINIARAPGTLEIFEAFSSQILVKTKKRGPWHWAVW